MMASCKSAVAYVPGIAAAQVGQVSASAPDDIALLLPWHAVGTLNAGDSGRVDAALARDPALAQQYAAIVREYAEIAALDDDQGSPSPRAMQQLFAAIDADDGRPTTASSSIVSLHWANAVRPRADVRPTMVKKIVCRV